jgi:hypothetical protein
MPRYDSDEFDALTDSTLPTRFPEPGRRAAVHLGKLTARSAHSG